MAVLAGPVAEMIHVGEKFPLDRLPQWAADWEMACSLATALIPRRAGSHHKDVRTLIDVTTEKLRRLAGSDAFWQVIAEVADLLEAYETIDGDQVHECLARWLGQ
jgi:hypothetical protein